jgi:hypothetical protein
MRHVGVLIGESPNDPVAQNHLAAFREALAKLGWVEGRNVRIDLRFADGDADRVRTSAYPLGPLTTRMRGSTPCAPPRTPLLRGTTLASSHPGIRDPDFPIGVAGEGQRGGVCLMAARLSPGAISESSSSHLPPSEPSKLAKPVMFPPRTGGQEVPINQRFYGHLRWSG